MDSHQVLTFVRHVREFTELSKRLGLRLRTGSDFEEFRNIPQSQSERHPINPAFNPDYSALNDENAFWLIGYSNIGEIVHTQAMKLIDLENSTLNEHLYEQLWNFRTHGFNYDLHATKYMLSPQANLISGKVTYHGELWLKGGPDGFRGGSLTVLLTRLMLLKGLLRWSPDFMIGLQSPLTSLRGLAVREGYMRMEQRSIVWAQKDSAETHEDWLVWMNAEDAEFNLRIPPDFLYKIFEKDVIIEKLAKIA